jgi:hypothetical protein
VLGKSEKGKTSQSMTVQKNIYFGSPSASITIGATLFRSVSNQSTEGNTKGNTKEQEAITIQFYQLYLFSIAWRPGSTKGRNGSSHLREGGQAARLVLTCRIEFLT